MAANGKRGNGKKLRRREAAERRKAAAILKRELAGAVAGIEKLEAKRQDLTLAIADPALYQDRGDSAKLVVLQKQLRQVEKDLSAAEDRWAKAQENWDAAQS